MYESWYMDHLGRLWLPTDDSGLQIIDFHEHRIYNRNNNPEKLPYLEYNYIRSFLVDETNNTLWLAPWGEGLLKFDLSSGKVFHEYFNLPEPGEARTINALLQTSHGTLLFTINGHCYEMNPGTMVFRQVSMSDGQHENAINDGPSTIGSTAMIRTADHHYWIGGAGLYQLNDLKTQNDLVVIPAGKSEECSDLLISGSGIIYSIHDNGWLVAVDKNMKNFTHYQVPLHPQTSLTELCEDQYGQLWIGSTNGIQLFDPASRAFHHPSFLPSGLLTANINVLFRDSEDNMWIGTRDPFHLYCYDSASGITRQIPQETIMQFNEAGKKGRISSIAEDDKGPLWMVSSMGGGILRYEKKDDRWTSFPLGTRNHNFLVNKGIVSILPGEDGYLWLSTVFGDGLVCYHYPNDSIIQYTREKGLLSDYVETIYADHAE